LLAKFFKQHQINYKFDVIFTSSESLEPELRDCMEEVFQCRIYDWYGQAERVAAIGQCQHGSYHIEEDYSIAELIPNGQSDSYEVVGTQLHNYVMPLLRYRTQDHVYLSDEPCGCNSCFRKVERIVGRSGNFLLTPEGTRITITAHIPCGIDNLMETQFYQNQPGEVVLKILTNGKFTEKDKEQLVKNTLKYTSPHMKVTIKEVASIPRGPNGKFISVINEIGLDN
jgi:phenylacetate-CoA ligase